MSRERKPPRICFFFPNLDKTNHIGYTPRPRTGSRHGRLRPRSFGVSHMGASRWDWPRRDRRGFALRGGAGSSSEQGVKPQVPGQTQARATDVRMWCGGSAACMRFAKAPTGQRRGQYRPCHPRSLPSRTYRYGPGRKRAAARDRAACLIKAVPERRQRPARPLAQRVTALPRRSHAMAPAPVAQVRSLKAKRPGWPPDDRACATAP